MRKTTPEEIESSRADFAELAAAVSRLRGPAEAGKFLEELFTPSECVELSKRWALMRELLAGKSQRAIARELRMSLCKITRGAKYARDPASPFRRAVLAAPGR
jgi:TrpR family trp operon transcriptional repressor